jgi:hypothetical protein
VRRLFLIGALALAASAAIAVAAFAGSGRRSDAAAPPRTHGPNAVAGVNFVSVCDFSHMAPDDPIVFPGQPGKSHDHTFVGNTSTDADSTLESLLAAGTTCQRPGDTAGYWVPTLLAGGEPVEPLGATVYYRRGTVQPVEAFPAGLRVIAGSAKATSPQGLRVTFWTCGARSQVPPSSEPPTCVGVGRGLGLRLHVRFPNCWDGVSLDSNDHQSHMAYDVRGRCPSSHPVEVPALALIVRYPVSDGSGVELASGGVYSAHADFFNAWNQTALERLVDVCLNALRHCGR